jgi:hypothetical protein
MTDEACLPRRVRHLQASDRKPRSQGMGARSGPHEQHRSVLGHREAQYRGHLHQRFEEAPSEVSLEFEFRQNLRKVPHLMFDLLLASFPKVRVEA